MTYGDFTNVTGYSNSELNELKTYFTTIEAYSSDIVDIWEQYFGINAKYRDLQ